MKIGSFLFLILCFNIIHLFGMEENSVSITDLASEDAIKVTILNQNNGDGIEQIITEENCLIAIFGTTPRYSFFENYKELLLNHLTKLADYYLKQKNRRQNVRENSSSIPNIGKIGKKSFRRKTLLKRSRRAGQRKQQIEQILQQADTIRNPLTKSLITESQNKIVEKHKILLKGVTKSNRVAIAKFVEMYGIANVADLISNQPIEKLFKLFFKFGINNTLLPQNIKTLLNIASEMEKKTDSLPRITSHESNKKYLVHIMMPCYFNSSNIYIEKGLLDDNSIGLFLIQSAEFFKELYKSVGKSINLEVIILIPRISYFKELILQEKCSSIYSRLDRHFKQKGIADLLKNEVIDKLSKNNMYFLANAHQQEIVPVAEELAKKDKNLLGHIVVAGIPIQVGAKTTKCFMPYTLNREKKYDNFKQSPIINSELFNYMQNNFINEKN